MKIIQTTIFTLLALLLNSCATTKTYQTFDEVKNYRVHGRAAIKSPEQSGQVSFSMVEKNQKELSITIQSVFAQSKVQLDVKEGESTLTTEGKTYRSDTPDELFYNITQLDWPISRTHKWLEGKPNPINIKNLVLDENNRPQSFNDGDWHITYDNWITVKNLPLPQNMTISKGDEIRIRIFIENWIL